MFIWICSETFSVESDKLGLKDEVRDAFLIYVRKYYASKKA